MTRSQPFLGSLETGSCNPSAPVCAVCMFCIYIYILVCVCVPVSLSNGVDFSVLAENNSEYCLFMYKYFTRAIPKAFSNVINFGVLHLCHREEK